jgi:hypothetical protein
MVIPHQAGGWGVAEGSRRGSAGRVEGDRRAQPPAVARQRLRREPPAEVGHPGRQAGSLAWLECEVAEVYHGGDHSTFLGTVLDATGGSGEALVFFDGDFHQGKLAPRSA